MAVSDFDPLDDLEGVTASPVLGTSSLPVTGIYQAVTSCTRNHVAGVSDPSSMVGSTCMPFAQRTGTTATSQADQKNFPWRGNVWPAVPKEMEIS